MLIPASVGREAKHSARQKAFRLMDLSALLAVLLHLEECLLDEIFRLCVRPTPTHEKPAQATEAHRQALHVSTMTRRVC